jgi:hypothetical protein
MNDVGDLLKLSTHSSTPTQLQEQEDRAREKHCIVLTYASSNGGQLSVDGPSVHF